MLPPHSLISVKVVAKNISKKKKNLNDINVNVVQLVEQLFVQKMYLHLEVNYYIS